MDTGADYTVEEFMDKYEPILDDGGNEVKYFDRTDEEVVKAVKEKRVWTLVHEGNDTALLNGLWRINSLGYIVCKVPYDKPESYLKVV